MSMTRNDWSRAFDDPIILPDGRELTTLRDAGEYITALPKATQRKPEWELATELLLSAAESGGILMMAEVAMRRAIGRGRSKPPGEPRQKRAKAYQGHPVTSGHAEADWQWFAVDG
jgi:hypothetical protein